MTTLTLSLILQASIMAAGDQTYDAAYHKTAANGQVLVVLIGADWCPGCRTMKTAVIPQLEKQGALKKVNFACINTDQQHELASKLMKGGSIPQLVLFRKTDTGWKREQMTGAHSVSETKSFIEQGAAPEKATAAAAQPLVKVSSR